MFGVGSANGFGDTHIHTHGVSCLMIKTILTALLILLCLHRKGVAAAPTDSIGKATSMPRWHTRVRTVKITITGTTSD